MTNPRNPFWLRSSEKIESDATFIRLFEATALDALPDDPFSAPVLIRSAPGGGKTSLLRLFKTSSLLTLHAHRSTEDCKPLYQKLKALDVINDSGPRILGVRLPLARTYATIGDLDLGDAKSRRLLFALLNARIALAILRSVLTLHRLRFPKDLSRVVVVERNEGDDHSMSALPERGDEIFEWARRQELAVCEALDALGPAGPTDVEMTDGLHVLRRFTPSSLQLDGEPVTERVLVMFDDVERLTSGQRRQLVDEVFSLRGPTSVWLAERMEALSADELLSSGALKGRDYGDIIYLEQWWSIGARFRKAAMKIADKRSKMAADFLGATTPISSFEACLQDSLNTADWNEQLRKAQTSVDERIQGLVSGNPLFDSWIKSRQSYEGTPHERAIAWRALEILITVELGRPQTSLGFALSEEELHKRDVSAVKTAAELFLAREFNLPYYFGVSQLAALGSSNVEQFLELAGNLFEEVLAAALIKRPTDIEPKRQEDLLRDVAEQRWRDLPRRLPRGREVQAFLETVGKYCEWETYRPSAPYKPGVTGIAISMKDRSYLADPKQRENNPFHSSLAEIISLCLAHNLLDAHLDYKVKGKKWMVLNLNRLLCLKFHLPLQYGGFREKPLPVLVEWLQRGFTPPEERNGELPL